MTPTTPPHLPAPVPGISAGELAAMQAAAARFLHTHPASPATRAGITAQLRALRAPAAPGAGGLASARRDTYHKTSAGHFMTMPHHDR